MFKLTTEEWELIFCLIVALIILIKICISLEIDEEEYQDIINRSKKCVNVKVIKTIENAMRDNKITNWEYGEIYQALNECENQQRKKVLRNLKLNKGGQK